MAGISANEEASALTTDTTGTAGPLINALRQEMRVQTAAAAEQMAKLTAAITAMSATNRNGAATVTGAPRGGRRPTVDATPRRKHVCKNCKQEVYHKDFKCMELPTNEASRYEGSVICLVVPIT